MITASYVIAIRIDSAPRLRAFQKVLEWLKGLPAMQIVVVEQDGISRLPEPGKGFYHVLDRHTGPFNKSRAYNRAVEHVEHEIIVFGDADMIMEPDPFERSLTACQRQLLAVNPYCTLVDVSEFRSQHSAIEDILSQPPESISGHNRSDYGEHLCFAGGIFVIRHDYFRQLGGMDERFLGWGGEDDAMSHKILGISNKVGESRTGTAYHLRHPRTGRFRDNLAGERNKVLLAEYRKLNQQQLAKLCAEHRAERGWEER